jgi:acetylornithine deacetylase/succinyl-diaminopimelate desuccinylase-like protein
MRRQTTAMVLAFTAALWGRPVLAAPAAINWDQVANEAIAKLQAYIRVDTSNPPGNETSAAELLRGWLAAEGIEARLYDAMNNPARQALVARLPGRSNETILLMSHSDVVPAVAQEWSHRPFAAEIANDTLYGRGALDTKDLGILQIITMLLLHRQGITPRAQVLLLIEPDEETGGGGIDGMLKRYPEVFGNVRMVLNEGGYGLSSLFKPGQVVFFVQTAEKGVAWMKLTAHGDSGHGSVPLPNNAVVTMARALERIAAYQTPIHPAPPIIRLFSELADQEPFPTSWVMRHVNNPLVQQVFRHQLTERPPVNALLRTTISLTGVHGGYKTNVIPAEVEATLDCRVNIGDSGEALQRELEHVVDDKRVKIELTESTTPNESPINEELMAAVRAAAGRHVPGSLVAPVMSSGFTDSAPFRRRGVQAYGFDPVVITEAELESIHGIDERLPLEQFRKGLQMYYEVVTELAGTGGAAVKP